MFCYWHQPAAGIDRDRRHILAEFQHLPVAGNICTAIFDIAEKYGKDTFLMIDKLGTDKMPFFFTMKAHRRDAGESLAV